MATLTDHSLHVQSDVIKSLPSAPSKRLRVLVACEYSGKVREAFRKLGLDAWSCDLLSLSDNSLDYKQGEKKPTKNRKDKLNA